jgi:hypothetical protein
MKLYKQIIKCVTFLLVFLSLMSCAVTDTLIHGGKIADFKNLDVTGVATEQSVKGWLYNSPSRRLVVVSAHTGPRVGSKVTMIDASGIRHTFTFVDVEYPIFQVIKDRPPTPMLIDDLFAGDITIGVLDRPAPDNIKAYNIAKFVRNKEPVTVIHQDFEHSVGRLFTRTSDAVLSVENSDKLLTAGDSGLPWFNLKNEVVSHNTLGNYPHGPSYSHVFIYKQLVKELQIVEDRVTKSYGN